MQYGSPGTGQPGGAGDGLYNRQPARRLILTALAGLQLTPATATGPAQITRPNTVQARLLELLGMDPTRPPGLDHVVQVSRLALPAAKVEISVVARV
ncbi:MAG: hypothetical protein ACRDOL_24440 [Streptosporangiaceae bacterium]